jgi:hypothetical protein
MQEMGMGVDQPGQDHLAIEVDRPRRSAVLGEVVIGSESDDRAVGNRD